MMLAMAVLASAAATSAAVPDDRPFDLVVANGRIVDGTGAPWYRADVGIRGDRIAAIGDLKDAKANRRIDARKLVVAPGFIDMLGQSEFNVLVDGRAASKITQGITTEITGEGHAIAPLDAKMIEADAAIWKHYGVTPDWTTLAGYFQAFERKKVAINLGTFVGAGGVRELVLGREERAPSPDELRKMEAAVAQAMEDGALGLSTSLLYVPSNYATTEEIIALARVARRYGGSYITHQREEGAGIDESLDEVFRIAREADIPAEIYHLKTAGPKAWGMMPAVLKRIEDARAQGLDVMADVYPWTASSNSLHATLPYWARGGSREEMVARLRDPAARAKVRAELEQDPAWALENGPARILIADTLDPALSGYEGKNLDEIAKAEGKHPADALMDIVIADKGNTSKITFSMNEDDVRAAVRHPLVSFCTDSGASATDGIFSTERNHPRSWGSMPRILGRYVREEKLLTLEEAIRKMTSLPATRVGLKDRGQVRPGFLADLVVFDPDTIIDRSTYVNPWQYSAGIPYVAVNGQLVVDGGKITDARPGRILRGPGHRR
jgi:dihydroorotase/N-acyl-D-amino-acid deacylase